MARRLICICGRKMTWEAGQEGKVLRCPNCRASLRIPTSEEDRLLIRWYCRCGQRLKARRRSGGRSMKCPRCNRSNTVPLQTEESSSADQEEAPADASDDVTLTDIEAPPSPVPHPESDTTQLEIPPDDTAIELPLASTADAASSTPDMTPIPILEEDDSKGFEVALPPGPTWPAPVLPRTPPGDFQRPAPSTEPDEGEGIRAFELRRYFNVQDGADAARAGAMQLLNGYWLFIPYALASASMLRLLILLLPGFSDSPLPVISIGVAYLAISLFLGAGFVACIKDGIFERAFGMERLTVGAALQFPRFAGTVLLIVPVAAGTAIFAGVLFLHLWQNALLLGRIVMVVAAYVVGLILLEFFLIAPVVAVTENLNPFAALRRGIRFAARQFKDLLTLCFVSMFVGTGVVGVVYSCYWMMRLLLAAFLPFWMVIAIEDLFKGLICTAIMGQLIASLMLLYLSKIREEERLIRIQRRLPQVGARPALIFVVIAAGVAALLLLDHGLFRTSSLLDPDAMEPREFEPLPEEPPSSPGFPRGLPIPPSGAR